MYAGSSCSSPAKPVVRRPSLHPELMLIHSTGRLLVYRGIHAEPAQFDTKSQLQIGPFYIKYLKYLFLLWGYWYLISNVGLGLSLRLVDVAACRKYDDGFGRFNP